MRHTTPQHPGRHPRQRGIVLVLVLWVLLALGLLALSFGAAVRTEVNASRNIVDQQAAYYLTRAGIDYAVYKIMEEQMNSPASRRGQLEEGLNAISEVFTGSFNLPLPGGTVEIKVSPETGKINLNGPRNDLLIFNLLVMIGLSEAEADVITDSILDWKDPDDFRLDNGAESAYYQSLDEPYRAKNQAFDVPEELLLVRGVTPEIYYGRKGLTQDGERAEFYGLQNYFTTFGTGRRIDVNTAPIQVLAAIPGLDYQDALRIDEMRPLTDLSEMMSRIPGMPTEVLNYLTVQRSSLVYSLDATGRLGENRAASRIRCVIRVGANRSRGYSVLYWNEANIEL